MNKKIVLGVLAVLVLALAGIGIYRQVNRTQIDNEVIKIGVILPLTGPVSNLANYHKLGIDLAINELNANGGVNGRKFAVYYEDCQFKADLGIAAFKKLSNIDKIPFIVATFSKITVPIAEFVKNEKTLSSVYLVSGTSFPDITKGSEYIYRSFINSDIESGLVAKFVIDSLKAKKVAIYCVNDDYGKGSAEVLSQSLKKADCNIVYSDFFESTQMDHKNNIIKIKMAKPDVTFLTGYSKSLVSAIKQMKDLKVKTEIITTATLETPDVIEGLGQYAEGIIYTSPIIDKGECLIAYNNFMRNFNEKFPTLKPNYQSAATYSLIMLIAAAIENQSNDITGLVNGFKNMQKKTTPVGNLKFDENREAPFEIVIKKMINSSGKTIYINK